MINILIFGILCAFLTAFLNYCIGKPGGDFSPYEIFSFYTVWLATKRLEKIGLIKTYHDQYNDSLIRAEKESEYISLKNDYNKMIYEAAEPFFTWERMIGMCSVCTCFWVTFITSIFFYENIVYLFINILISHITIRLLNKII